MKTIILSALFMAVFMGSGANAQTKKPTGYPFFAKSDQIAQGLIKEHTPEGIITAYLDRGIYSKYWKISQADLADLIYNVSLRAQEMGCPSPVTSADNASALFSAGNYGTATVASLKKDGIKTVHMGMISIADGKVKMYEQPLSGLDDRIEFGVLYDGNGVPFPVIKKGIDGLGQCCLNICYPKQEEDNYVDDGDGGGQYSDKTVQRSGDGVVINNYNIIENSGNSSSDQSQEQEQEQTAPAPVPQQQGSGFVPAQISYQEVPMQMNQPINYNPGYSAPPVNYGNSGTVVYNNRPNGLDVADFIVDVATLGVGIYGANQLWKLNNKPAPIYNVTGGNTTYGTNSYNSGVYGNGLLPTYTGPGGGTGTGGGGGPIDIGNGGPGND